MIAQRIFTWIAGVLWSTFGASLAVGQAPAVSMRLEPASILIGEPVTIKIQTQFDPLVYFEPQVQLPDSIPHVELQQSLPVTRSADSKGRASDTYTFVITSFDSGRWEIPALSISFADRAQHLPKVVATEPQWLTVRFAPADTTQPLRTLKPIRQVPKHIPWQTYAWWAFWATLGLTLLGYVLTHWRSWRKKRTVEPVLTAEAAYQLARRDLQALVPPDVGDAAGSYSWHQQMKRILRTYLGHTRGSGWSHLPTGELLLLITPIEFGAQRGLAASVLRRCDVAIFARYLPDAAALADQQQQALALLSLWHESFTSKPLG